MNIKIRFALLPLMIALLATSISAQDEAFRAGQRMWRSCSNCHCVPDQKVVQDADWLKLNMATTCITGEAAAPKQRRILIAFLNSKEAMRPLLITEKSQATVGKKYGSIRVPSTAGSAYLKADRDSVRAGSPKKIRLNWPATKSGQVLVVPVGRYRVVNYGYYRQDQNKKRWSLSGSSAEGCASLRIEANKESIFSLAPEIHGHLSASPKNSVFNLAFYMSNKHGVRMTIACDGALADPTWVIGAGHEKIVDRGKFEVT